MLKRPSITLWLLVILFIVFVVVATISQQPEISAKKAELNSVQADLVRAKQENEQYKEEAKKTGSKEYIEKVAREELGMVKEGEIIFIDIDK